MPRVDHSYAFWDYRQKALDAGSNELLQSTAESDARRAYRRGSIRMDELTEILRITGAEGSPCTQCGGQMNPAEAMGGKVCVSCTRKNHARVAGRGLRGE